MWEKLDELEKENLSLRIAERELLLYTQDYMKGEDYMWRDWEFIPVELDLDKQHLAIIVKWFLAYPSSK